MCLFIDVLAMYIPTGVERIIERAAIPVKHSSRLLPEVKYKNILQRKAFSLKLVHWVRVDESRTSSRVLRVMAELTGTLFVTAS